VLGSSDGKIAFDSLAKAREGQALPHPFPIHLYVASPDQTVCDEKAIRDMKTRMPSLKVSRFNGAHSIHNTARPDFLVQLIDVVRAAEADSVVREGLRQFVHCREC
jgi:hypothetical protein